MKVIASYKGTDPNDCGTAIYENVSAIIESPSGFILSYGIEVNERKFLPNALCDKGIEIEREDR